MANQTPSAPINAARRRALLRWFGKHQRTLPWRKRPADPYHVLVSEAMLQQTQVSTAVPYFKRFIDAFPSVEALARSDQQRVLRLWQGLGYYRRATNLHAAAAMIVQRFGGTVPAGVQDLLQLPGVGRYTAGAVASIAHGTKAPILDGNVARVLARWFGIPEPIDRPDTRARLWQLAERLLPPSNPGDFNQALMELGALVCTAARPQCASCPVCRWCAAARDGTAEKLPRRLPRRRPRPVAHHVVAVEKRGRYLFVKRPEKGLWSNMWQLPTAEDLQAGATARTLRARIERDLGLVINQPRRMATFDHQTTHRSISFQLWRARVQTGRLRRGAGQWRSPQRLEDMPLANPQRRAVAMLTNNRSPHDGPS